MVPFLVSDPLCTLRESSSDMALVVVPLALVALHAIAVSALSAQCTASFPGVSASYDLSPLALGSGSFYSVVCEGVCPCGLACYSSFLFLTAD